MPPDTENKSEIRRRGGTAASIVLWWQKFHFSGRVIMCSVLFGLGLLLIGGIIFAINVNDDSSKSGEDFRPHEMPPKPPSNVVGPVIMGIGGFIVTVGVIMCLFETQVCRKKTADSSPLISENHPSDPERKDSKPEDMPPKTHNHSHKHGARKGAASPKRSKSHHAKSRSKEKKVNTLPVSIDVAKSFMTSSEEKFLTPPSTIEHPSLVHRETREAENQTSASLMKSFDSSGPSWTQSSEFQTPSTSFRDSPVSLENSTEVSGNKELISDIPTAMTTNFNFMTPITTEEEKVQKMATEIQNQKKAELNSSFEHETKTHLSNINVNTTPESEIGVEKEDLKLLDNGKADASDQSIENRSNVTEHRSLSVPKIISGEETGKRQDSDLVNEHNLLQVKDSQNTADKGPEVIQETTADNEISNQIGVTVDEETNVVPQNDPTEKLKPEEGSSGVSTLDEKEQLSLIHGEKEVLLRDAKQDHTHRDLESSASSDETVVSESSVLEKPINVTKSEENGSEKLHLANQDGNLDTAKSNSHTTPENDIKSLSNHSNMPKENKLETTNSKTTQNDIRVDGSSANLTTAEVLEGTTSSEIDFVDTHNIQSDTANESEAETSNLKHSEESDVKDANIEEHAKVNSS